VSERRLLGHVFQAPFWPGAASCALPLASPASFRWTLLLFRACMSHTLRVQLLGFRTGHSKLKSDTRPFTSILLVFCLLADGGRVVGTLSPSIVSLYTKAVRTRLTV
jgi:hypothetical protein